MTTDEIHSNADSHAHTESNANAENISNAENVAVSGESLKAVAAPKPSFTCIGRGHGAPVLPADREAWESLRREPWLAEMCRRIEEGDEALKRRLPVWTPHCAAFRDNHRAIADALQPLQRLMLDFDEKGHSAEILERALRLQDEGRWEVLLVEDSVRRGTHVLITVPREMTAEVAQARFSTDVGFSADSVVKDVSRCIYMVPQGHTLYVNEERLFRPEAARSISREETAEAVRPASAEAVATAEVSPAGGAPTDLPDDYDGIPYAVLVDALAEQLGGVPVHGSRNTFIFSMACHLRYVCNDDPAWIAAVLPDYGEAREKWWATVQSACRRAQSRRMPRLVERALALARERTAARLLRDDEPSLPPPMPRRLPALIRLLLSRTPELYRPAVAHAVFPALAAHLCRVRFRYIDNVEHEATLMNVLMAGTGAGKDCISEPINRIMADIRRRDEENLRREREWKQEVTSKGANKDKRQRPEGLVIQEIDADMTNPAFVMRMAEADGHFLYTKLNEIDQFDALRGSGRGGQQFQIMCLAFDPGNRYGQTRVGAQSVTEKVTIRFNWNAATTIQKGKRYFAHVLTDGPVSRINFCTIPEREIGADMPVYGTYDAAFDEQLRPYIEQLTRASGLVDCPQAFRLATKLREENAEFARLSQSRVYENLSFRANVIAWLKACVLYVASGYRWDKSIEDFVRWSLRYDLWCKMEFFGAAIEEAQHAVPQKPTPGRRNLLELLPNEFTVDDAVRVRRAEGMDAEGTRGMLRQWVHRRYVTNVTNDKYEKLRFRRDER